MKTLLQPEHVIRQNLLCRPARAARLTSKISETKVMASLSVERGYVIIVSETERGDRVTIEITTVRENVAFGDVVDQEEYFQ